MFLKKGVVMMNFYEYLQLRTNEAGEIPPTAGAAPAQAPGAAQAQAPVEPAGVDINSIASSMNFLPTTKKKLTYNFANSTSDMPPMSYAVANEQEEVVTATMDGKETKNTAMPDDIIMSGPSKERYVVKAAKFPKLYSGTIGSPVIPEQSPRQVALYSGKEAVNFKAPWGEDMVLKPGDYLVKEAEGKYYRIAKHEYEITYSQPGKNESWMRGIFGESPSKKKYDGIN